MQEKVENLFLAESNETAKHFGSPISYFLPLPSYIGIGPCPIQLVVVMAVRKAVRAVKSTKSLCTFRSESYHLHRYLNNTIRLHNF